MQRKVWQVFIAADTMVEELATDIDVMGSPLRTENTDVLTSVSGGIGNRNIWRVKIVYSIMPT